uniref:Uncharacterized protein n=1 Tax=Anguilla anguilla TaxID=7936 RepID=A0A0E9UCM4_ANGAN
MFCFVLLDSFCLCCVLLPSI